MPEGPIIRNTADLLRNALEGQQIMRFHNPLKKAAAEGRSDKLIGQTVLAGIGNILKSEILFGARIHSDLRIV
jgi:formamidopyrimidine-DNA glycosylase